MSEITKGGSSFVGYDYMEVSAPHHKVSLYLDGYKSFGWLQDSNVPSSRGATRTILKLKRDRKILNKTELTRLQQHFEACMDEIETFEKSKGTKGTIAAITVGLIGTVFMALSTFAVTHEPAQVLLCILFAIPGFTGWTLPYFLYQAVFRRRSAQVAPLIEQKYDELYKICQKASCHRAISPQD